MQTAQEKYRAFIQQEIPIEKVYKLYQTIDREAAINFARQGYTSNQIKAAIFTFSFYASRLERDPLEAWFQEIIPQNIPEGMEHRLEDVERFQMGKIYTGQKNTHQEEFQNLFCEKDIEGLHALLNAGFSQQEMRDTWEANSLFQQHIEDIGFQIKYESKVHATLKREREEQLDLEKPEVEKAFLEQQSLIQHKYSENPEYQTSVYREGEILLPLILEHDFLPETIELVARENAGNMEAIPEILLACGRVKRQYDEIAHAPSLDDANNAGDLYRIYAHRYLQEQNMKQLNFNDDCILVKQMLQDDFPQEYLNTALLEGSPVACEAGRNRADYVKAVLSEALNTANVKTDIRSNHRMDYAKDIYDKSRKEIDTTLKQNGNPTGIGEDNNWQIYYDTIVVRKMLLQHIPERDIAKVLNQKNPNSIHEKNYDFFIIEKAKQILRREQELIKTAPKKVPEQDSYTNLRKYGFTPLHIFQHILQQKLQWNPSIARRLYEPGMDIELIEACLTRYPEFEKEALLGIIRESPRAILLKYIGIPEEKNYAENILKAVEERETVSRNTRQEEDTLLGEYNRLHGLAYQGIEAQNADSAYQCGRSSLQLMLKGYDEFAIRNTLLESLDSHFNIQGSPAKFVDNILAKTKQVYFRILAVRDYDCQTKVIPITSEEVVDVQNEHKEKFHKVLINPAEIEYMRQLHAKYMEKNSLRPSMDIEIIRNMLLQKKFPEQEILEAVQKHSPLAVEAGRDDTYITKYLLVKAQKQAEKARRIVAELKPQPRPREDVESDIQAEYRYHKEKLTRDYPELYFHADADVLIGTSLMMEGFMTKDIAQMLQTESPLRDSDSNYGIKIIGKSREYFSSKEQAKETTPVLQPYQRQRQRERKDEG